MKALAVAVLVLAGSVAHAQSEPKPGFSWGALLGPASADAIAGTTVGFWSGEQLYRRGRDAMTVGYVAAVYDSDLESAYGFSYCVPNGVTTGQATDVFWRYLVQHPEVRHLSAAYLVRTSFRESFPCH